LPVEGSTLGDAQAMRCAGTSVWKTLKRFSQISLPVSASRQSRRSWVFSRSLTVSTLALNRYRRLPKMAGVERDP
jgi:hypothetical protein